MNVYMYKMVSVKIFYCVDLGDDWDRAILDYENYEDHFLHFSFGQSCEGYQIGGSTDVTGVSFLLFEDYLPNNSGIKKAKI